MPLVFPVGEDPLADSMCDMDLVAGVLKLYFRTLEKPLFPQDSTTQLLEYAGKCVRGGLGVCMCEGGWVVGEWGLCECVYVCIG